jgi:kojibiose phosphorylase
LVDLIDNQGNTQEGIHIASAGGTWQMVVCGFGGFRVHGGRMTFKPWLPPGWNAVAFKLKWHGNVLSVEVRHDSARFLLTAAEGSPARRGEGRQGSREDIVVNGADTALPANEEIVVDLIRTLR